MKQVLVASSLLLLSACSAVPDNSAHLPDYYGAPEIYIDGSTLYYVAGISEENTKKALDLANANEITALYIDSPGGDVFQGMALARLVMEQGLDVYIGPLCASSCANYILAAGKKTYLQPNSILGWHGSSYQRNISEALVEDPQSPFKVWRTAEQQFFTDVQVSPLVTVCGFDSFTLWDRLLLGPGSVVIAGFTYSLDQLTDFGYDNIVPPPEGWNPPMFVYGDNISKGEYCESVSWDLGES